MTIREPRTIDWLGIEKQTGRITLTVVDDLDWRNEQRHLELLQTKLNTYLAFVESGEVERALLERLGRSVSRDVGVVVEVYAKHEPSEGGLVFLQRVKDAMSAAGLSFSHVVLGPGEEPLGAPSE